MMKGSLLGSRSTLARTGRPMRYALPLAIVLLAIAAFLAYQTWTAGQSTAATPNRTLVSATEFEELYGLRLKLLAVTAGGGLVDFRLKVVDADKAGQILANPERTPSLIVEGSATPLAVPGAADSSQVPRLDNDDVYIALIPNSESVVKPGTLVVVAFGDLELEPVLAQ